MNLNQSQYPALSKRAKRKGLSTWKIGVLSLFLLTAFCLLPTAVRGQGVVQIRSGATVPTKCTPKANDGLFYKNSGSNIGLYECTATNTWTYRGSINFGGTLTPSALSGNVNDYNPTGLSASFAVRIDGGASDRNITGLATGSDGRLVLITNIGSTNTLTLKDASSSSTAANRFLFGADLVLPINSSAFLRYDGTSSRWRPVGQVLSNSGATAGSYGTATQTPTITIGADGRVTLASNTTIALTPNQTVGPLVCTDAGSTDAYACTASPAATSYTNLTVIFTPNTANTGASTININSLGVKNIKKLVSGSVADPDDNDLRAGGRYLLSYDGTQMLIVSLLGNAPSSGLSSINGDPTAAQVISATDASLTKTDSGATHSFALPYKLYVAHITQSGTNAPVATVLENTLGGTIVWTRTSAGTYLGTLVGAFPTESKVVGLVNAQGDDAGTPWPAALYRNDADSVVLLIQSDGSLSTSLEIRVYP